MRRLQLKLPAALLEAERDIEDTETLLEIFRTLQTDVKDLTAATADLKKIVDTDVLKAAGDLKKPVVHKSRML